MQPSSILKAVALALSWGVQPSRDLPSKRGTKPSSLSAGLSSARVKVHRASARRSVRWRMGSFLMRVFSGELCEAASGGELATATVTPGDGNSRPQASRRRERDGGVGEDVGIHAGGRLGGGPGGGAAEAGLGFGPIVRLRVRGEVFQCRLLDHHV